MTSRRRAANTTIAAIAAIAALVTPASALAAPPANDDRTGPQDLGRLPAQVTGTTVDATRVATDPSSACGLGGPQVWYRFTAPADGRIAVRLAADGDLDAILDAYLSERSQTTSLDCDPTDTQGMGAVDFQVKKGSRYLIAVSMRTNSVAGDFQLTVVAPQPPARPPGRPLASGGADGTLDRVGNTDDAYSLRMRAGHTYRFRLSGRSAEECGLSARLFGPRTTSFEGGAVKRMGCDASGYETFTPGPGEGGRYSILVSSARGTRSLQRYHLESAAAGPDDLAPGRFIANHATVRGSLDGSRVDALDLYRFSVSRRSDLTLRLTGGDFGLLLLNDRGHEIEQGSGPLRRTLRRGRYFVAVRAPGRGKGAYKLTRTAKVLTRTSVSFGGHRRATLGQTLSVGGRVRPAVGGPFTVIVERFDPLSGWLFYRQEHGRAASGHGSIGFRPPTVGRWRARATYDGTLDAGPSASGFAEVLIVG